MMKIRSGYVSNSSSSSFVIVGKHKGNIFQNDNIEFDFINKKYIMIGGFLFDGDDIITLNQEMFDFIKNNKSKFEDNNYFDGEIYEYLYFGEDSCEINIVDLYNQGHEKLEIFSGEIDYHSSENIEILKDNYNL